MPPTTNNSVTSNPPAPAGEVLVRVEGVGKKFCRDLKKSLWYGVKDIAAELVPGQRSAERHATLRPDEFWAVDDVSFELRRGECLGLIGRNGAGKTTLLKMLNGLIKPDKGRIEIRGRVGALIALGAGFNPILTGRENIYVNAAVLGLSKKEIDAKFEEIVEFAELGEFIDAPVQSYSSGMAVRLGFAVASALKPDILLLDEVLAVGDADFRSKCWHRIGELLENAAVILVSHEAYAISRICDRAILISAGQKIHDASPDEVLSYYANLYRIEKYKKFVLIHEAIESAKIKSNQIKVHYGGCFVFTISIVMREGLSVDHAVVNICDENDVVHAQSLLDFPVSALKKGVNSFVVVLGPLYLSMRRFVINLLISTSGGKIPLVNAKGKLYFDFVGHVSYGPKYYPPSLVAPIRN